MSSLRRNFSWAFLGNAFYAACQFAVLVLLAKVGSAELVGRYSLGLALCTPIVLFANLKLAEVQATDAGGQFAWSDYFGLRLVTTPLAFAAIAVLVALSGYPTYTALVVLGIGLSKSAEALSDLAWGAFLHRERNDLVARSQAIRGVLIVIGFGLGVGLGRELLYGIALVTVAWSVVAAFDLRTASSLYDGPSGPRFDSGVLKSLALLALPLGFTVTIGSLQVNAPRYLVEQQLGETALGLFAGMSYLLIAGGLVLRSISMAATPRLAKHWFARERRAFVNLLARIVGISVALGLVAIAVVWALGEQLLWLLFDPVFAERSDVLLLLMVAAAIGWAGLFFGAAVNAMRRFRIQIPIHASSLVVVVLACVVLLPEHGLIGAAWALAAGSATTLVLYVPVVAWYLSREPEDIP